MNLKIKCRDRQQFYLLSCDKMVFMTVNVIAQKNAIFKWREQKPVAN